MSNTIFVKIDRSSIIKNLNAGVSSILIPGREILTDEGRVYPVQRIQLMHPIPLHSFEYVSTEITCKRCHAAFDVSELEDYSDIDAWEIRVCPKCGTGECCDEIVFEEFDEKMVTEHLETGDGH